MTKEIQALLNQQINKEFYSAYLYLDIYSYYTGRTLNGFAHWFQVQAQEERDHAMLFLQYMLNNSLEVTLEGVKKPGCAFANLGEPLAVSLEHERSVTASINAIYDAAYSARDFRTMQFLDWFVREQGEEEKNSEDNLRKFELFGGDPKGLYLLDAELAARVYAPPTLVL